MAPPASDPATFRGLPKAELHQHLDGSMRPETAVELAAEAGRDLTLDEARQRMVGLRQCADQAELLTYFDLPISLLQSREALARTASELVMDLAADGVLYAEVRWAPRLHLEAGLSVDEVIDAVAEGVRRGTAACEEEVRPIIGLIVTAMRSHPPGANVLLAQSAARFGPPIVAFDLAGPEARFPAPPHAAAFRAAEEGGLALTAHAGEVAGSERIRDVLTLGVRRIAHGVTAADDADLLATLRMEDVTLDLCPTSNVQAGIVRSLEEHPLAALHRAGVSVTLSTDDLTVTDTTLSAEYARVTEALRLEPAEVAAIALNAFRRAFAPAATMRRLTVSAEEAWQRWAGATIS